jgi:hypothetical protein
MTRSTQIAIFCLAFCPVLRAQQAEFSPNSVLVQAGEAALPDDDARSGSASERRDRMMQSARTISICSETVYLPAGTLDRALMKQKDWEALGLNILNDQRSADLEVHLDRIVFTHIHTYVISDKATGIVLASGRVRALDGVVASGPMAEQIVKLLSAARLRAHTAAGNGGL